MILIDTYQLSQIDPRNVLLARIVLQTELNAKCDKLPVDHRKYCQLSLTDDVSVYRTPLLS